MKNIEKADYIKELQGKRIKECMKLCGLKGVDLAKKLNYTPQQISYVINGHRNLTADVAISMAKIFTECLNKTHTITVEMPYSELSVEEKEEYQEEYYNGNSWINVDYEDIDSVEMQIEEVETRILNVRQQKISGDNIYHFLLYFDKLYDKFTDAEKKEFLNSFIERVDIYEQEQPDGRILKHIKFRFPVYFNGKEIQELSWDNETTVDTV